MWHRTWNEVKNIANSDYRPSSSAKTSLGSLEPVQGCVSIQNVCPLPNKRQRQREQAETETEREETEREVRDREMRR